MWLASFSFCRTRLPELLWPACALARPWSRSLSQTAAPPKSLASHAARATHAMTSESRFSRSWPRLVKQPGSHATRLQDSLPPCQNHNAAEARWSIRRMPLVMTGIPAWQTSTAKQETKTAIEIRLQGPPTNSEGSPLSHFYHPFSVSQSGKSSIKSQGGQGALSASEVT